ncbi:MAG TPA: class I SAM-dependent rRNA methyltransferase [Haloplasmataceae bacterium]
MIKITLKSGIKKRIEHNHPWVYANEVDNIEGEYKPGDIVYVFNNKDKFIGKGYINPKSLILVRLLTRDINEEIDETFFRKRILNSYLYRKQIMNSESFRVIFGEADGLPGLIVDKFNDYLSLQTLTLGIEQYKELIVKLLIEIIQPKGIYERNDNSLRLLEGLEEKKGILYGKFDEEIIISENGIKFYVDIASGQKTGSFLDQKANHNAIKNLVKDKLVLDCFTHTGGFGIHAACYGAKHVDAVDISESALQIAQKNAQLNSVEDKITFICGNAFDILKEYTDKNKTYDVVILDPPAFTKSAKKINSAYRGYKEINLRGMKLVKPNGFLVTASCSHYMSNELFKKMLTEAALDAHRVIREVEYRTQDKDHPILWGYDESQYLKLYILQII